MTMNWSERLARAEVERRFSLQDESDADSWFACAVFEKCKREKSVQIQRECDSIPNWRRVHVIHVRLGSREHRIGHKFHEAVRQDDIPKAKEIYEQIQRLKT